ncbi:MAG: HlyD family efflux transporter periplasmic adaptor subunit [Pseudomonadales bacterium]|nr:HlyD family efflux transporter periplasmic adaptor subunit [Pseudomonadales bacterium]NRA14845.1 HlyD family efflux transporter periplasmic adaptor subunit [Oceanospirillaceae bacterium]
MSFDSIFSTDSAALENYHKRNFSPLLWVLLLGLCAFCYWASQFRIDQVARANGEVIASSRVQIIQAVDGGVLAQLLVREGDNVKPGQVLARLDPSRFGASVKEIDARLSALNAKAVRLRAEVTHAEKLLFSATELRFEHIVNVERALFQQRRSSLQAELKTLQVALDLASEEMMLIEKLSGLGDVNKAEVIDAKRLLNEAEAKLILRKNRYLEEASSELTKVQDGIAQNSQILAQRQQQLDDSVFRALLPGIVKNINITTVGGVLRSGEELMQIIPIEDELIIEAKVRPADIAQIAKGLDATIRFDPFDYTIYGGVRAKVVYVSPDTLKEQTQRGEEIYYRVHLSSTTNPVRSTTGKQLDILPGMTAQVDIRTGDRTVLEYLLKPLRKTLSQAFGER